MAISRSLQADEVQGADLLLTRGRERVKGKGPATSTLENGGSDSSLADDDNGNDHGNENLRNGSGLHGGYPL